MNTFDSVDIADNLEVYLVKGEKNSVEIEADDNLHDAIIFEIIGSTLKFIQQKMLLEPKNLVFE